MLAQGEAQAEGQAQPWGADAKKHEAPEGRQKPSRDVLPPLRGFVFCAACTQGLLASLAAPWANIGRPLRGLKTATR
jgi:hypothetical protein